MRLDDLFEKQDYEAMFNPIERGLSNTRIAKYKYDSVVWNWKEGVRWARQSLKRKDRIVWFLRLLRIGALNDLIINYGKGSTYDTEENRRNIERNYGTPMDDPSYARRAVDDPGIKQARDAIKVLLNRYIYQFHAGSHESIGELLLQATHVYNRYYRQQLAHAVSMEHLIPGIKAYRWHSQLPDTIRSDLRAMEETWKKDNRDRKGLEQGNDKTIMEFPNGWRWVLLDRRSCPQEAEAMGHCGNSGSTEYNDRILSLREPISKKGYKPHLTFIINNGVLGEMKARWNEKPKPDMHPYIIELLKNPMVMEIRGGGHAPENNFHWDDITKEEQAAVLEANPELEIGETNKEDCDHDWQDTNGGWICAICDSFVNRDDCRYNVGGGYGYGDHEYDDDGDCTLCGHYSSDHNLSHCDQSDSGDHEWTENDEFTYCAACGTERA